MSNAAEKVIIRDVFDEIRNLSLNEIDELLALKSRKAQSLRTIDLEHKLNDLAFRAGEMAGLIAKDYLDEGREDELGPEIANLKAACEGFYRGIKVWGYM